MTDDDDGGLVAVHAHPDDETLFTGALLATWAHAGRQVDVVTCTRGEAGEVIGADLAHLAGDGPALGAHRTSELRRALAALGAEGTFLDELPGADRRFIDSGMVWVAPGVAGPAPDAPADAFALAPLDAAAAPLAEHLRRRRPRVVATYGPAGGYGHPDHVQAHLVTMRAVELATSDADPWRPQVWWALGPEPVDLPAGAAGAAGDADDAVVVELAPVLDTVTRALRAHATQVTGVRPQADRITFALSNEARLRLGPLERYAPAPGWAGDR